MSKKPRPHTIALPRKRIRPGSVEDFDRRREIFEKYQRGVSQTRWEEEARTKMGAQVERFRRRQEYEKDPR